MSAEASARAASLDSDGSFPIADVQALSESGLLRAEVAQADHPTEALALSDIMRLIGYGSLPLGRLFEGHVNALQLIALFAGSDQRVQHFQDAADGHLFGVWNTEPPCNGLTFSPGANGFTLKGAKTLASGAGHVTQALVTARLDGEPGSEPVMLVVPLTKGERSDVSSWHAHGMRASATGSIDFSGLAISSHAVLGKSGDYHRQPYFSGGAWRFAAVQLGGIEAVFDAWRDHIVRASRASDPYQLARLGDGALAVHTARHWVERAAAMCVGACDSDAVVAYVNLARTAVERAGMEVIQLAQRSVGLAGFMRDHPLERRMRDLATYLRQPAPDKALSSAAAYVAERAEPVGDLWRHQAAGQ